MSRPAGSRNTLIRVNFDSIGALVGIRGNMARRYAQRGENDARNLESILRWINGRRQRQGLPLVGLPDSEVVSEAANDTPAEAPAPETRGCVMAGGLVSDPMTGGFRGLDGDETR